MLAGWPDAAFEHEVELLRFADFVVGIGVPDVVSETELAQLWAAVVIKLAR